MVYWIFQEEISSCHNQRRDAETVANCNMLRVSPNSKLNAGFRIFPGVMLPGEEGEIEPMKFGDPNPISIEDENLALQLAETRSGVSQPQQGLASGTFNKRGVYTAMGTLSLLQESDNRTSLNISDIRYAHTKLGRLLAYQYAVDGTKSKFQRFGDERADLVMKALNAFISKRMALSVMSASASINREVEKQNDMMLANIMKAHYQAVAGMLQGISSPMTPPAVKDYLINAIKASDYLMKDVLRVFDKAEPERMVPEINEQLIQQSGQPAPGAGGPSQMAQPPGGQAVPGVLPGGGGTPVPSGGQLQ